MAAAAPQEFQVRLGFSECVLRIYSPDLRPKNYESDPMERF
jgi:hypothetical protein